MSNSIFSRPFNVTTELLDKHLEADRGDRPALYFQNQTLTYGHLFQQVCRAADTLRRVGIGKGQRVMLVLQDSPEFIISFLAALRIGAVPVPVSTLSSSDEYAWVLGNMEAAALITDPALLQNFPEPIFNEEYLKFLVLTGQPSEVPCFPIPTHFFSQLLEGGLYELDPVSTKPDDWSYWLYSSGTTGRPKGVIHEHGRTLKLVDAYSHSVLQTTPQDSTFSVSRLFFSYGLNNSLFLPLSAGASTLLVPEVKGPLEVLRVIERHRPSLFFSVPSSYKALNNVLKNSDHKFDLNSLRLCISAGEPLPAPIHKDWTDLTGVEVLDGIGSTEAGYIFISNRLCRVRPGSSGEVVAEVEARIVGPSGQALPPGQMGDLEVKSPGVAAGYWQRPTVSKKTFNKGWLRTGDKYTSDERGYYYFVGRSDDLFRVSAQWVSPAEIESCLLEHPAVEECAVISCPDHKGLEKPKAFVVVASQEARSDRLAAVLQDWVKGNLASYKIPRWVEWIDLIPKTATGKIQRYKLRERDRAGT